MLLFDYSQFFNGILPSRFRSSGKFSVNNRVDSADGNKLFVENNDAIEMHHHSNEKESAPFKKTEN